MNVRYHQREDSFTIVAIGEFRQAAASLAIELKKTPGEAAAGAAPRAAL